MAKITSSPLTFIDQTDSRKFEVQISSNLPQSQLYDKNTAVYTPDWSSTPLNLQASIYLDSMDITANINYSDVEWYKNTISTATKISSGKTLTINTNVLDTEPIITYICQAKYQNLTTGTRIDYTRIDNGVNGAPGASAPAVQAQYSVDGSAWTTTLNASEHKYVRYSYDGGATWTTAIKMAGEDGTSVNIIGTAYTPDDLTEGEVVRLYSDSNNSIVISTDGLSTGDSYLVNGYLCVYNADNDNFMCVGTIQGPMNRVLWSGAIQAGATISLAENLRNFKFLTCIIGDSTNHYEIVLVSLLDDEISKLNFFGFVTNSYAASEHYGAKFVINNQTSLNLIACGTSSNNDLYCRKIVGWR